MGMPQIKIKGLVVWVKNWEGRGREQYWLRLRYTNNIFLERKKKTITSTTGLSSNPNLPRHKIEIVNC
jgi:hypothetical protein